MDYSIDSPEEIDNEDKKFNGWLPGWLRRGRSLGLCFRCFSRDGEETARDERATKKHWSKISVCPSDVDKKEIDNAYRT